MGQQQQQQHIGQVVSATIRRITLDTETTENGAEGATGVAARGQPFRIYSDTSGSVKQPNTSNHPALIATVGDTADPHTPTKRKLSVSPTKSATKQQRTGASPPTPVASKAGKTLLSKLTLVGRTALSTTSSVGRTAPSTTSSVGRTPPPPAPHPPPQTPASPHTTELHPRLHLLAGRLHPRLHLLAGRLHPRLHLLAGWLHPRLHLLAE
ncbi:hypothetical protein LSAT2_003619 [Lamellibrachia satsuma]|nr:hypothetical protein LSAT2_003619 [Lamellibrachia satsuma]